MKQGAHSREFGCLRHGYIYSLNKHFLNHSLNSGCWEYRGKQVTTLCILQTFLYPAPPQWYLPLVIISIHPSQHLLGTVICQALDKSWGQKGIRCELPRVTDTLVDDRWQDSMKSDGCLGLLWEQGTDGPNPSQGQKWLLERCAAGYCLLMPWQVSLPCWQSPQLFSGSTCSQVLWEILICIEQSWWSHLPT